MTCFMEENKISLREVARFDASSFTTGVSLVYDGAVREDACWLCPEKDSQHINLMNKLGKLLEDNHLAFVH